MSLADELERLAALHEKGVLSPEEFAQAKARLIAQGPSRIGDGSAGEPDAVLSVGRLRRSHEDRWLGGICGGIAKRTGMESWVWRLIFTALFLMWGTGILIYILLWIFIPDE